MTCFGIIGGYGAAGGYVAQTLLDNSDCDVLICGRNGDKAKDLANSLGSRASWAVIDVFNPSEVNEVCEKSDIIINCTGPSAKIFDRIAKVCIQQGKHYIDPAGDDPLYEHLEPCYDEIKQKGLRFVLSAGAIPGISEVFLLAEGKEFFDSIHTFRGYQGGIDEITFNSAYDFVCGMRDGLSGPQTYHEGGQKKTGRILPLKNELLPEPAGLTDLYPNMSTGQSAIAEKLGVQTANFYSIYPSGDFHHVLMSIHASRAYKTEEEIEKSAALIVDSTKRGMQNRESFFMFHLIMEGTKDMAERKLVSNMTFEGGYWMTGSIIASTALSVYQGKGDCGCFMYYQYIDEKEAMKVLERKGIVPTRTIVDEEAI